MSGSNIVSQLEETVYFKTLLICVNQSQTIF